MKQGGHGTRSQRGFTIVETMIVLAVTGMIFLSAAALINGKEARVQFTTSIQNLQQQIQQVINEVQSGYDSVGSTNIKCVSAGGSFILSNGGGGQGTNLSCLFLGKALQFGAVPASGIQPLHAYTVVGNRLDSSGNEATTLAGANPTVLSTAYSNERIDLLYGLTVAWIQVNGGGRDSATSDALVFMNSLGSISASGDLIPGSQSVDMYPLTGGVNLSSQQSIATKLASSTPNPTKGVGICVNSGTTNQSGLITIGGPSGGTNVALKIYSAQGC